MKYRYFLVKHFTFYIEHSIQAKASLFLKAYSAHIFVKWNVCLYLTLFLTISKIFQICYF